MTNLQFDILDELYFVCKYAALQEKTGLQNEVLSAELRQMISEGWVKAMEVESDVEIEDLSALGSQLESYAYLATKKGLMLHNSRV